MLWKAYETTTEEILPNALSVHDKFYISGYLNKAVDATRRKENRVFLKEGLKYLTGTKVWLKGEWDKENRLLYETLKGLRKNIPCLVDQRSVLLFLGLHLLGIGFEVYSIT